MQIVPLLNYIGDRDRAKRLAVDCGTTTQWLWQVATGWTPRGGKPKRASPALALDIDKHSGGLVPKECIRSDIWPNHSFQQGMVA